MTIGILFPLRSGLALFACGLMLAGAVARAGEADHGPFEVPVLVLRFFPTNAASACATGGCSSVITTARNGEG